jgi:hypothetical protein
MDRVEYGRLHRWDVTPQEAIRIQQELRAQLITRSASCFRDGFGWSSGT